MHFVNCLSLAMDSKEDAVMPASVRAFVTAVDHHDFFALKEMVYSYCDNHMQEIFAQYHWRNSMVALDHAAVFGERDDYATMAAAHAGFNEWLKLTVMPFPFVLQYVTQLSGSRTHIYAATMVCAPPPS